MSTQTKSKPSTRRGPKISLSLGENGKKSTKKSTAKKKAGEPTESDVHVPGIVKPVKNRRTAAYIRHLMSQMKQKYDISDDDMTSMVRKARAHAGGMVKAKKADEPSDVLDLVDDDPQTGVCVMAYISEQLAEKLALPGGEDPSDLHITLCYLGDAEMYGTLALAKIITAVEDIARWSKPLTGEISGTGRFDTEPGESDIIYASPDVPGLVELQQRIVQRLANVGIEPQSEHGFDPHITLAYVDEATPTPDLEMGGTALRIDAICVAIGEDVTEFQLGGMGMVYDELNLSQLCADGHGIRLFNEVAFAEPPASIPLLPKPGTYHHRDYGKIEITEDRNREFVDNLNNHIYQEKIPIDLEHETKLSGAAGYYSHAVMNEDGSVDADDVEWTDLGRDAIEKDRFKYFSPEWFEEWMNPMTQVKHANVLVGGALTVRPFFKDKALRPLVANENGLFQLDDAENVNSDSQVFYFSALPTDAPTTAKGARAMADKKAAVVDDPEDLKDKGKDEGEEGKKATAKKAAEPDPKTFAEVQAELRQAREESKAMAEQLRKSNERTEALENENQRQRFSETVKSFGGTVETDVPFLQKLAKAFGETSDEVKAYIEERKAHAEQLKTSELFKESGRTGGGASDSSTEKVLKLAAAERTADPKLGFAESVQKVFADPKNRGLEQSYRAENTMTSHSKMAAED